METTPALEPSPPPSWAVSDLVAFVSFFLVTLFVLPIVLLVIGRAFIPNLSITNPSGETQILLQMALDLVWVGFIFFLVRVIHRKPILESIRWIPTAYYRVHRLVALGAALALSGILVSSFFPPASPPRIEQLAESPGSLYLLAIFGVCFAPIIEEIIFRGFLFNAISDLGGSRLAVLATATLFALLHSQQLWPSWAGIALILVVGYVLSSLRKRSDSLIPSFIVHTAYNSMLVVASLVGTLLQKGK